MSALEQLHRELLQQESLVTLQRQVSTAAGQEGKSQASTSSSTSGSKQASSNSGDGGSRSDSSHAGNYASMTTLASNSSCLSSQLGPPAHAQLASTASFGSLSQALLLASPPPAAAGTLNAHNVTLNVDRLALSSAAPAPPPTRLTAAPAGLSQAPSWLQPRP